MTMRNSDDELARLRRLRDRTLGILDRRDLSPAEKLQAIGSTFERERSVPSRARRQEERDEDAEDEEARDRERLS
jgi:hypothetical protein